MKKEFIIRRLELQRQHELERLQMLNEQVKQINLTLIMIAIQLDELVPPEEPEFQQLELVSI